MAPTRRSTTLVLAAAVLVALVASLGWWLASGGRARAGGSSAASPAPAVPRAEAAPGAAQLAKPQAPETTQRRAAEEPALAAQPELDPADARWIDGRVLFPPGAPSDPTLAVVAVRRSASAHETPSLMQMVLGTGAFVEWFQAGRDQPFARAAVGADGRFSLAVPKELDSVSLDVDGRWLRLGSALPVALVGERTHVELRAALGGFVAGRVLAPEDASMTERDLEGGLAWLLPKPQGFDPAAFAEFPRLVQRVALDVHGRFELRGVATGRPWTVFVEPPWLQTASADDVRVEPGATLELELEPERGATVIGVVRDDRSQPIEGAELVVADSIDALEDRGGLGALLARRAQSAQDGTFRLSGLPTGSVRVRARKEGIQRSSLERLELEPGQVLTGVVFELDRGKHVAGRVVWPDGTPAAGALVQAGRAGRRVEQEAGAGARGLDRDVQAAIGAALGGDLGMRRVRDETTTDAQGRFVIDGLGLGDYVVEAWASEVGPDGERRDGGVRSEALDPSVDGLELVLIPQRVLGGTVVDQAGRPVERFDVDVAARAAEDNPLTIVFGSKPAHVFEGTAGRFRMPGLEAGQWALTVRADGYSVSRTVAFDMPQALDEPEIEVRIVPAARVKGRVLEPDGLPAAGARVTAGRPAGAGFMALLGGAMESDVAVAGPDGTFVLEGLDAGNVELVARGDGGAPSATAELALAPGSTHDVTLALRRGGRITGEVLGRDGAAVADARVQVMTDGFSSTLDARTDAAGRFAFDALEPGRWQIFATPETAGERDASERRSSWRERLSRSVEVADEETVHVVLGAEPRRSVTVSGTVRAGGEPHDASVTFRPARGGSTWADLRSEGTDDAGHYELRLDAPGEYAVTVTSHLSAGASNDFVVTVPDAETHEHDFVLPLGRISGRVTGPDGEPAAGVPIRVESDGPRGRRSFGSDPFDGRTTGDDGTYSFDMLAPGTYTVLAGGRSFGLFSTGPDTGRAARSGIAVGPDEHVAGIDFTLEKGVEVSGRVIDADGLPVAGAAVWARSAAGSIVDRMSPVRSDKSGHFRYAGLAPGTYTFSARTERSASRESAAVQLAPGRPRTVEVVVLDATMLVALGVDESGAPVRTRVLVRDAAGNAVSDIASLDTLWSGLAAGSGGSEHAVGPLAPGVYAVVLERASDGARAERSVDVAGQDELRVELAFEEPPGSASDE